MNKETTQMKNISQGELLKIVFDVAYSLGKKEAKETFFGKDTRNIKKSIKELQEIIESFSK